MLHKISQHPNHSNVLKMESAMLLDAHNTKLNGEWCLCSEPHCHMEVQGFQGVAASLSHILNFQAASTDNFT